MGPMRAASRFARELAELFGSLALTGQGHATDRAVLLGLSGYEPATIDPSAIGSTVAQIRAEKRIHFAGRRSLAFDEARDLVFRRDQMYPPGAAMQHPNGLRLTAFAAGGATIAQ